MYTQFFGLNRAPFSIAPDPHYLFMSERHREALAHLLFGLKSGGGFVLLTGEIGAGKTTVCRLFLEQIPPNCNVAYIFNPKQTVIELLRSICDEFGIDLSDICATATIKDFIDPLNTYLLAAHAVHQNNVLIIDEAQNLSADVLEQLRLLTNLETNERKLLQIVLIGQPELRLMLAQPELEQLAQRVIARFHLQALSPHETAQYIIHRLGVAGNSGAIPFDSRAMRLVHRRARGIPRRINLLCDRAMLGAYAQGKREVDAAIIEQAAHEVFDLDAPDSAPVAQRPWRLAAVGLALVAMILGGAVVALQVRASHSNTASAAVPPIRATDSALKIPAGSDSSAVSPAALSVAVTDLTVAPGSAAKRDASLKPSGAMPVVGQDARDVAAAYRRLGQLWQLSLAGDEPCAAAQKVDMFCFRSNKGLAEIRQLDRPGILTLYDDAHQNYYVLLRGLSADQALLQFGEQLATVSLTTLAHRWEGEYATLWHGPAEARRGIAKNARSVAVGWLISRLALAETRSTGQKPVPITSTPIPIATFDTALATQVREFQLSHGLLPDGVAGPQTLMQLASLTDPAEPHLQIMNAATHTWVKK